MRKRLTYAGIGLGALVYANPAHALKFTFSPVSGTPQEVVTAVNQAGQRWSSNLSDSINLKITIQFSSLSAGRLAETDTVFQQLTNSYGEISNALTTSARSADDLSAVSHLQTGSSFKLLINRTANSPYGSGSATPYLDADNDANNLTIRAPMANLKALGYTYPLTYTDATITLNSAIAWDYDPSNGVGAGKYDFVGIVTHEIGHVLGLLSGVDALDSTKGTPYPDDQLTYVSVMDLFRYSTQSIGYGDGVIDFTADTRDKYFSVDGGATKIASFATGLNFGDGTQASHWKDNRGLGIFDPTAATGELLTISENDLRLLDVIGFERNYTWQWAATQGGKWSDALSWNTAAAPGAAIEAVFNAGAASSYTVNFTAPAQAQSLRVGNNAVTFQLAGQTLTVANHAMIGNNSGEVGSLTLAGPGMLSAQSLSVGGSATAAGGSGHLTVNGGAALNVANTLKVWNTAGSGVTINGGSVSAGSIHNGGSFDFASGTLSVSGDFVQSGGSARFAGKQNWGVGSRLLVQGGSAKLLSDAGEAGKAGILSVEIQPAGQVEFQTTQHLKALSITGGSAILTPHGENVLVVDSLYLDSAGTLDLTNNDLVVQVNTGDPATVLAQITQLMRSARNSKGKVWTGAGITSSAARDNLLTGLALALNDQGNGKLLNAAWSANSILVKYTWNGDVNFDGTVNLSDYFEIDRGYLSQGSQYVNGDVNYDGTINLNDYFLIDSAYLAQTGTLGGPSASLAMELPDPSASALLLGAGALLTRRRRRS